jgi:methionine salvage enolase-phosphatase E1
VDEPSQILFATDVIQEAIAAKEAGIVNPSCCICGFKFTEESSLGCKV